jgi:hypothetical protein
VPSIFGNVPAKRPIQWVNDAASFSPRPHEERAMRDGGSDGVFAMGLERLESLATAAGAVEVTPSLELSGDEVARRIDEGFALLIGCALHFSALAAEGLTDGETRRFRALLDGLKSAEALHSGARSERAATVRARLFDAVGDAAGRLRARAAFAFRFDAGDARLRAFSRSRTPSPRDGGRRGRSLRHAVELKLR